MLVVAWGGAALFAGSLLYFAYFYLVQLGRPIAAPAGAVPGSVAVNLILFSAFALHHSVAARLGAKAWMSRWVPRHLERSLYVWMASVLFLAVCLLWRPLPGAAWQASGLGRWALHAVQLGGLVLTLRSAARIDIWELAGVRQTQCGLRQSPADGAHGAAADYADGMTGKASDPAAPPMSSAAALEVRGPYRWVRHPIYLGWVLLVWGAPAMTTGRLLFAGVSTLYLIVAIPIEERSLTTEFGPAYTAYQRQVRWRLVPGLW